MVVDFQRLFKKSIIYTKENGVIFFILKAFTWILHHLIYRKWSIIELKRSLLEPIYQTQAKIPVTVEILPNESFSELLKFQPDLVKDEILKRLANGDKCFVARRNGQIIHTSWVRFRSDDAVIEHVVTKKAYRGKGISPVVYAQICQFLKERGVQKVATYIESYNSSSVKSFIKAGFQITKEKLYIKTPFIRKHMIRKVTVE